MTPPTRLAVRKKFQKPMKATKWEIERANLMAEAPDLVRLGKEMGWMR